MKKKIICLVVLFAILTFGYYKAFAPPVILYISPFEVTTEVDVVNVVIKGYNFAGADGFSGCGISPVLDRGFQLRHCKEVSDTEIHAQFGIANDVVLGPRSITVTVPKKGTSNAVTFTVIP